MNQKETGHPGGRRDGEEARRERDRSARGKVARTLDEQQADAVPESVQALPEPRRPASPEERQATRHEKEPEEVGAAKSPSEGAAAPATVVSSNLAVPVGYHRRQKLPPVGLITPGELVLAMTAACAVFFALWWVLGGLAVEIGLPQVLVARRWLIALAVGAGIGTSLWIARRAKRINRAKHLRGELPT